MAKDPTRSAAKWARNLSAASEDMIAGADRVTQAPGMAAVAKKAKLLANFTAAVNSGKWEQRTGAVSVDQWRQAYKEKGIPRIQGGTTAAQPKMTAFLTKLMAYQDSIKGQIKSMPDITLEDGANRAAAWVRLMGKYKG